MSSTALALRPERVAPVSVGALAEVAGPAAALTGAAGVTVTGITHDSTAVRPGDVYAALPGARRHGAEFCTEAAAAGAGAILTDAAGAAAAASTGLPVIVIPDPRAVLGTVAAAVYGNPSQHLLVVGITGTNGKTTTTFMVEAGLRGAGRATGLIGTIETRVRDEVVRSVRTTPEAPDLHALLAVMVERGVDAMAMEVSSHALALHRVDGLVCDVAGFTNLSEDHVDPTAEPGRPTARGHASLAEYEAAKASLFTPAHSHRGVLNVDDPAGRRIAVGASVPVVTYGQHADWSVKDVTGDGAGSTFTLDGPLGSVSASVRLPGAFNVANAACALITLAEAGVDLEAARDGVAQLSGVPGRMELVDVGQPWIGIVDYAHSPDAVERVLAEGRKLAGDSRLIGVLGCGGDRDQLKRPVMGSLLATACDVAILTSDNPRSESAEEILEQMRTGATSPRGELVAEVDRERAIAVAVERAKPGDVLMVLGKGHEQGQESGGVIAPFDDRDVLRRAIEGVA